jgi:hypothetical protein
MSENSRTLREREVIAIETWTAIEALGHEVIPTGYAQEAASEVLGPTRARTPAKSFASGSPAYFARGPEGRSGAEDALQAGGGRQAAGVAGAAELRRDHAPGESPGTSGANAETWQRILEEYGTPVAESESARPAQVTPVEGAVQPVVQDEPAPYADAAAAREPAVQAAIVLADTGVGGRLSNR